MSVCIAVNGSDVLAERVVPEGTRPPRKDAAIQNVEYDWREHGKHVLSCEFDADGYHIWIDPDSGKLESPGTIHKSPPRHLKPHDPGYYHPRRIKADAALGRWLITQMRQSAQTKGLREAAQRKFECERKAKEATREKAERQERIREAAIDMYEALRLVSAAYHGQQDHGGIDPQSKAIRAVRAAIAKAERCS